MLVDIIIYVYALMNVKSILNLEELEKLLFELDSLKKNNEEIAISTIIFRHYLNFLSIFINITSHKALSFNLIYSTYQYKLFCIIFPLHKVILKIFISPPPINNIFPHFFHSPIFSRLLYTFISSTSQDVPPF